MSPKKIAGLFSKEANIRNYFLHIMQLSTFIRFQFYLPAVWLQLFTCIMVKIIYLQCGCNYAAANCFKEHCVTLHPVLLKCACLDGTIGCLNQIKSNQNKCSDGTIRCIELKFQTFGISSATQDPISSV